LATIYPKDEAIDGQEKLDAKSACSGDNGGHLEFSSSCELLASARIDSTTRTSETAIKAKAKQMLPALQSLPAPTGHRVESLSFLDFRCR
jgi:hypothetical protein